MTTMLDRARTAIVDEGLLPQGTLTTTTLKQDASNRSYHRVASGDGSVVVMELADDPLKSEEVTEGQPAPTRLPFFEVGAYLERVGVPVPAILLDETSEGFLILEDLGDVTLEAMVLGAARGRSLEPPTDPRPTYRRAIELLVQWQSATTRAPAEGSIAFARRFDRRLLAWELEHFVEYGLLAVLGDKVGEAVLGPLRVGFAGLLDDLVTLPTVLCHRDFQSRNIMERHGELVLIDFQDALVGPVPYDLVALLRDSYVRLLPEHLDDLVRFYWEAASEARVVTMDLDAFSRAFRLQTVQRKLKDAGRFVYIDRVKGNRSFLPYFGTSVGYAVDALAGLEGLEELGATIASLLTPEVRERVEAGARAGS